MRWMIQDSSIPINCVDDNGVRLLEEVKKRGLRWSAVGMIPFTHEITGLGVDISTPTIFYGSTQMAEKVAKECRFRPGVFWGCEEWWDPGYCVGKRDDLLNEEIGCQSVRAFREHWVTEPTFVKSREVKALTGMVVEPDKADRDNWLIEHADLDGDDGLILAPYIKLEREWRFFVVDGKVITGSTYRKDGVKIRNWPVSKEAWAAAELAVTKWMPCETIVIDICRTASGDYKVVEFNCVNCSGFYKCDIGAIVDALEAEYGTPAS